MIGAVFGIGGKRLIAGGKAVTGTVIGIHRCWWLKVNTKPVRLSGCDGAVYPHIITVSYAVDGVEYTARRWLDHTIVPPVEGKRVTLFYDSTRPKDAFLDTAQFGLRL